MGHHTAFPAVPSLEQMTIITDLIRIQTNHYGCVDIWLLPWVCGRCHGGRGGYPWKREREKALENKKWRGHLSNTWLHVQNLHIVHWDNAYHCDWAYTTASASEEPINWVGIWLIRAENIWRLCFLEDRRHGSKGGCVLSWDAPVKGELPRCLLNGSRRKQFVYSTKLHRLPIMF